MHFSILDGVKLVLLALFIYLFFLILKPFIPALILALALAIVAYPLSQMLNRKLKLGETGGAFLTVLLTVLFLILPLFLLILLIGREAVAFIQTVDLESLKQNWLGIEQIKIGGMVIELDAWKEKLLSSLQQIGTYLSSKSVTAISTLSNSLFLFFVFLLLYYYFLKDAQALLPQVQKRLPYSRAEQEQLFTAFREISRTIFYGNLLSALAAGVLAYLGFWLFDLPGALIWALLAAILSFIPAAGTLLIYLTGIGILAVTSGWMMAAGMAIYFVVAEVLLRENWIKPKLMEDKLNLHPILVFLALVGGVSAFGSMGLIYGPLIVTFLGALWQFYGKANLKS